MTTTVLIQSAQKPYTALPLPDNAIKIGLLTWDIYYSVSVDGQEDDDDRH